MQMMNMEEIREQQQLAAYYETFNRETNNGRVFVDDLSATKVEINELTTIEKVARLAYHDVVSRLVRAYPMYMKTYPIATTKEEVLQQRVVAPCLKNIDNEVSKRSATNEARAGRLYPRNIHPWTGFQDAVAGYHLDNSTRFDEAINGIFLYSLNRATNVCCDEADEQGSIISNLNQTLIKAGIIHEANKTTPFSGKIDFCIMKDKSTASIICECKSTHNLLLPMTAVECKAAYDAAYVYGERNIERSPAWANVAHPIAQLLSYMVDNEHCFGALTSGTKTYFIKIQSPDRCITDIGTDSNEQKSDDMFHMTTRSARAKRQKTNAAAVSPGIHYEKTNMGSKVPRAARNLFCSSEGASKRTSQNQEDHTADNDSDCEMDSGVKVYISDAWCVGEENYLRAWAYMHTLHESAEPWIAPIDWIKSTTNIDTPNLWEQKQASSKLPSEKKNGEPTSSSDVCDSDADSRGNSAKRCNLDYYYTIHQGKLDYVPFDDIVILGVLGGGRNGNCFKVQWNGTECAMKQFDIGRDGNTYFEKEIQAYMLLQKAWGILVPRPMFLSESFSGGRLFLGLQLGRESTSDEDLPKFENVLQQLETEYGIRHCDAVCGRNMIVITDSDGVERVAAIDLEDWVEV